MIVSLLAALLFPGMTDAGLNWHCMPAGNPLHSSTTASFTLPEVVVTVAWITPVVPAPIVMLPGEALIERVGGFGSIEQVGV